MNSIFVEETIRIIFKNEDEAINLFVTQNPHTGHVFIEDNTGRLTQIEPEQLATLTEVLTGLVAKRKAAVDASGANNHAVVLGG